MAIRPIKSIIELGMPNFTRLYRNCRELSQTQMFCSLLLASLEHLILYRKGRDLEALFTHTLGLISQELSEDFRDHNKDSFDDLEYLYDSKQIKTLNSLSYDFAFLSFLNSIHSLIEIPDNKSSENEHLHEIRFYSQQLRINIRVIDPENAEIKFCVETPFVQLIVFQKANKFYVLYPFEYQIYALDSQEVKGVYEMEDMRKNNVSGDLETEADFSSMTMLERSLSQRLSFARESSVLSRETSRSRQTDLEQRMRNRSRLMKIKRRNTRELRMQNSLLQVSKDSGTKEIGNVKIRIQYDKYLLEATEMEEENRVLRELKAKIEEKEMGFKRTQTHMYMQGKSPKVAEQNDAEIEARIREHETEMERLRELERLRNKERRKEDARRKEDERVREERRISEETLILEVKRKEIERKIAEKRAEAESKKKNGEKKKESSDDAVMEKESERKLKADKQLIEARRVYEDRKAAEEKRLYEQKLLAEEKKHERKGLASKALNNKKADQESQHLVEAVVEENVVGRLDDLGEEDERRLKEEKLKEEERVAKEKMLAEERWVLEEKRRIAEKLLFEEKKREEEKRREDAKKKELIKREKEDEYKRKREEELFKEKERLRQEESRKEEERQREEAKRKEEMKKRIEDKKAEQEKRKEEERQKEIEKKNEAERKLDEEKRKERQRKEEEAKKIEEIKRQEREASARLQEEQKKKEEIKSAEEKRLLEKKRLAEEMRLADARRKAEELSQQEKRRRQDLPQPATELPEASTLNTPEELDNTSFCGGSYCSKCLRELKRSNYLLKCETCCERFFKGSSFPSTTTRPQRSSTALCMNCGAKVSKAEPVTCMCCFIQEKVLEGPSHSCSSCCRTDKCYWIDVGEGDARDMKLCGFCDEKKHMEAVLIACKTCRDTVCLICLRKNPYVAQGICSRCHNRRQVQFV